MIQATITNNILTNHKEVEDTATAEAGTILITNAEFDAIIATNRTTGGMIVFNTFTNKLICSQPPNIKSTWNGTAWVTDLDVLKTAKVTEITKAFLNTFKIGMSSSTLGVLVDVRRSGNDNDLQNYESLYDYMVSSATNNTQLKVYDNSFVNCTVEQLKNLITEIKAYAVSVYQKKFTLLSATESATNETEINTITWN
jgi:hypothetical protein